MFRTLTNPNITAEMVTYLPIASPFIRLGGFWVDDAWGFALGWNYFFLMGMLYFNEADNLFHPSLTPSFRFHYSFRYPI